MRKYVFALKILAIVLVLKPNVAAGKDMENINVSAHVAGIGSHFKMDECIHFGGECAKVTAEECRFGGKEAVNTRVEAKFDSICELGNGDIIPLNKRSVPTTKDIACAIIEGGTGANAIFDAEECNLDKRVARFDLLGGIDLVWIDSEAVKQIDFKQGGDGADVFPISASAIGGRTDEIGSSDTVAGGLAREDEIDRIVPSEYLAFVGFADWVAGQISQGDLCICAHHYVGGEEIHDDSCSFFGLCKTEMEEKKQDWKYFRVRYHNLRMSISLDIPHGFVHNSWSCDLDVSEDGKTWYHIAGECYDRIPTLKMFAPKSR